MFTQFISLIQSIYAVFKKEIRSYFFSSTASIYMTLFLFFVNACTFYVGDLIALNEANLIPFFTYHIYIYILFLPALAMKSWSEEHKSGTIDLLLTFPISTYALVIGKFLASWGFMGIALLGTFPVWITINILGSPDNNVIYYAYLGSFLIAGALISICSYVSVQTDKQIIAFIVSTMMCFIFLLTGFPVINDPISRFLPDFIVEILNNFSILTHYDNFIKGYWELSAILYIINIIIFFTFLTRLRIQYMRMKGC